MARPIKNNADYFTHDKDMRNDPKIRAVRAKFGNEGYAIWCYILECLTNADRFKIEWNDLSIELYSGDFMVDADKLIEVVNYMIRLKLLTSETEFLTSVTLQKRMEPLLENRDRKRAWDEGRKPVSDVGNKVSDVGNEVKDVRNTQSKVKESKGEYSKEIKKEKNAQDADFEIKNSPAESDAGNEEGSSKNSPLVPALPPQDEPVESLGGQVMDWAKRNRTQILSKSREVGLISDAQTPQQAAAEIKNAIEDWCSYHAERDAFKLDPVGLFREKYHTWFRIRAEKNASAKSGSKPRGRAAPKQDSSVSYSPEQCAAFFRSRYGFLAELYTTNHANTLAKCQTKEQFEDLLEKQYESLKAKANGNARKGPQDLSSVIGSSLPVHQ